MNSSRLRRCSVYAVIGLAALWAATFCQAGEPKKLLVVTITLGARHGSIATAEKVLAQLADESRLFTVDYVREPRPRPPRPGQAKRTLFDTDEQFKAKEARYEAETKKAKSADDAWLVDVAKMLADRMSLAALARYDGVIFANTTGELPLPDKAGFIQWVKSGKAFIGMHAATDTLHGFPPYIEMIGGEFGGHPWNQLVTIHVADATNPASKPLENTFDIADEIYQFKTFSRQDKQVLLELDASNELRPKMTPKGGTKSLGFFERGRRSDRDYAVSWVKPFGNGRVFYTSLGHYKEVWEDRRYQAHILGGIRWALDLQ